ncbi:ABC transporter ATP-binding protein [Actinoallomurus soli]|uniref:ABC transporter ATP-binding protein n=1 Tax=Actinoallomurus soli TaxID=2952535 RepID=UPI0020926D6F|nr:ABC transporter ATP-binding protein [Actinoallomurus soli]MCO5972134.1 ABC transporter ATP-binding protein [Actinoallomurus soli]
MADLPAITLRDVVKRYRDKDGSQITAVDGLTLDVPAGVCLGLLGPNGAGKSTTMRMLTAQSRADEGEITVLGHPVPAEAKEARALMGVVPQTDNLDEELTVRQNLEVFAHLYRLPRAGRRRAVERALEIAQLTGRARTRVVNLSGGMRRRLLVARGLVHSPRLVLLDEPTVGLDPQVRADLWGLIAGLRDEGTTVLMSTHYIEEAERLADACALMSGGRIVAQGTPGELIAHHAGDSVEEHHGPPDRLAEIEALVRRAGLPTRRTGPTVSVLRAEHIPPSLADALGNGDRVVRRAASLEDVFVVLTGENVG